jgi:GntR family transcriptional regulator, negative regulator for fad regulon and positive regulator of fabA
MATNWIAPQRPNTYAEQTLINAILDGIYPSGATLPGERALAAELGVTRPTLREALQRLARDGWLTVRQGKATAVNNFWRDGGLNVLSALVQHGDHLPPNFVEHLLAVRLQLAPAYTAAAVNCDPAAAAAQLAPYAQLADAPGAFAAFDWQLHRCLTIASGNPIYTLILNGFADFYETLAQRYFANPTARVRSRTFYADLATAVAHRNAAQAEALSRTAMQDSLTLWREAEERGGE